MTNEINKKQTLGRFDIVGNITVDSNVFALGGRGKNNQNWISNVFNPRVEGEDGASMFVRIQDGYHEVNGKTIYVRSTNDESMEIKFADRFNENILSLVNEMSFIKVFTKKVEKVNEENGSKYFAWEEPKKFLTVFDAINFLNTIMPLTSKNKVRMTGEVKYTKYNGKVQRNFELKTIYILTNNEEVGKEIPLGFNFTQNIIVMKDAVNMDKFETEGIATVQAKLYVRKAANQYEIIDLPLTVRSTEENKATYKRVLEKYMTVADKDRVRRINIEGVFKVGYVSANVNEAELPPTALELLEDGFYTREEVLKMYLKKEKVDETLLRRPIVRIIDGTPAVDMSETDYTIEDINRAMNNSTQDEEEIVVVDESSKITESLLDELNGL